MNAKTDTKELCGHEVLFWDWSTDSKCRICGLDSSNDDDFMETSCEEQLERVGRVVAGKQVTKGNKRLAFINTESNTIHLADAEEGIGSYDWAECGTGGRKSESIYIHESEFGNDYIVRDGEVIGKLCGNCSIATSDEESHFND